MLRFCSTPSCTSFRRSWHQCPVCALAWEYILHTDLQRTLSSQPECILYTLLYMAPRACCCTPALWTVALQFTWVVSTLWTSHLCTALLCSGEAHIMFSREIIFCSNKRSHSACIVPTVKLWKQKYNAAFSIRWNCSMNGCWMDMTSPSCFQHKEMCYTESHLFQMWTLRLIDSTKTILISQVTFFLNGWM